MQLRSNKSTFSGDESGKSQRPTVDRKQLCHHWTSAANCFRIFHSLLLQILANLPIATAEAERMCFRKWSTHSRRFVRQCTKVVWKRFFFSSTERSRTPSIAAVIDRFALTSARRLNLNVRAVDRTDSKPRRF